MGYDYHTIYYSPSIFAAYQSASPYITVPSARVAYNSLKIDKTGYTWGVNVGWFCYGVLPVDVCPNLPGDQVSVPPGYVRDAGGNCVVPDRAPTVNVDTINCVGNVLSGVALDGDWSGDIDVHIYIGGPPGSGAPGYALRTSGHRFQFSDPAPNQMYNKGQTYYVYAIGVNSSGVGNGNNVAYPGNPVTMGPCNAASCGGNTFPATMLAGKKYSFNTSMTLAFAYGPPYTGATGTGTPAYWVAVTDPDGATVLQQQVPYHADPNDAGGSNLWHDNLELTPTKVGTYRMWWSLSGGGIPTLECPATASHRITGDAGYRPYFTVTGGDILSDGDIKGWENVQDGDGSWSGAGTNLAALAGGNIQNFLTGFGLSGGAASDSGAGLGFANTTKNTGAGTYGGGYGSMPSFLPTAPAGATVITDITTAALNSLAPGTYVYTLTAGNISLPAFTLPPGVNLTIQATAGNVFLGGNIGYNYGGGSVLANIPRLTVIATAGNIIVSKDVTELHGVFYAGGNTTQGNFYTCGTNATTPIALTDPNAYTNCNKQLTLYGAVTANKLILSRTYGNLIAAGGAPAEPAENFIYTPELWLAASTGTNTGSGIDNYVSLPPVL